MVRAVCRSTAVAACIVALAVPGPARAQAVRDLAGFRANTLQANDDGSTDAVGLGFAANFFGSSYSQLYVNNNGNVTFGASLDTYTPFGLTTNIGVPIIAPFFADVDTRGTSGAGSSDGGGNAGNVAQPFAGSGLVTYGNATVDGRNAFGVNYFSTCNDWTGASPGPSSCAGFANNLIGVGYFADHAEKLNVFQVLLIDRSDTGAGNFDIEYNYNQLQWETGDDSNGSGGLGGSSAHVGYSNGSGSPGTFYELAGSGVNGAFLDGGPRALAGRGLGSAVRGRYALAVRNGQVVIPPVTSVPEPASLALVGAGLLGAAAAGRRRRAGR